MLQTDNELDDFKDQMIEVSEEDLIKLSGNGDGDGDGNGDGDGDGSKAAGDKDSSENKKAEKKSSENKKAEKKSSENKKDVKKPTENKKDEKKSSQNKQAEKKSAAGTIIAALIALVVIGGLVAIFVITGFKNDLVGTWKYTHTDQKSTMVFEFKDDGTVDAKAFSNNLLIFYDEGTYTSKSGYLTFEWKGQGKVPEVEYKIDGDKLTFGDDNKVFVKIKKKKKAEKMATPGDSE